MTKEQWGQLKQELLGTVGKHNFANWIEPLELSDVSDGVVTFNVPTTFTGNYVSRNFGDLILFQVNTVSPEIRRVHFRVPANGNVRPEPSAPKPRAARPAAQAAVSQAEGQVPAAPLDDRFTFDNFVVGKPNELAHAAARRVAEGGPVTFNPLFLYGGVGLGKTHLMHAIAWELQSKRPDLNVVYLSAEQFMYRFVQALRDRKMMDFKEMFRSVDVLMVDDVQFIAGKDSTQEEFFHTFNALVDQNKQIVISADRAPGEIENLEDRIKSRLQCGLVVDLHPTDYELRLGILQSKVDRFRNDYPGLQMADGVLEFLAHRISTNVRVLEGALTRLYAFASLVGHEITLELAQDCLADILRASERKISIEEIQRQVSEHYNIRLSDMIGPKRVRTFARPRQVAMYLCKQMTSRSLPEIGRRFGGRDHTTVMHGVKRIDELRHQDAQIAEDLELLRRTLEG
ncbi:chromosomal replication initiator protein DnaA [Roseovarius indicus]|uniref:Chromosomal replication initiator protein DnaA n=1 Tax=Roseovarius indicus TaxID=540747 RepID=A0A0T5P6J8_9RHOB|nr:chromosomal replication initiator protein DnaA [Roseovarius indicus]KRS16866.1 chromosomal replication initiation protein [Roseovarius indicus]OAO06101.1 chromosomal replication initiation protein DnaA [Roseovarius indicus]QEW24229.1 Chromosomal replication initiator protein DnaA [Roseovarius indicus]SFD74133.1 chromosomal replication initiator protein DnaA [Roseovarius indicus]